ncbi:equilibrative nucleoside transporter 3-like [Clytia hemisphaerica]|uniref:Equilibrative nucleoside transporter 3 n=1 Tax=Clytia hemisphaerica TaxID=252671 RepID=A0A7M5VF49_9CNID
MMTEVDYIILPEESQNENEGEIYSDTINRPKIYFSFFLIGIGMLLPWNFFINADQYFKSKLKNNESDLKLFESAFSICSQIPCGIALIINLCLTNRVSRNGRVISTLILSTICFIVTTVLVNVDTSAWTDKFFYITLGCIVIINICSGIYQGTIFGITGAIGPRYIQASITGVSFAGLFASITDIISIAIGNDIQIDATVYFTIASLILCSCIVAYVYVSKTPFVVHKLDGKSEMKEIPSSDQEIGVFTRISMVVKMIYPLALSVTSLYTITIGLMPAILCDIKSVDSDNGSAITNKYFSALTGFLIFNVGDLSGRVVSGNVVLVGKKGPWLPLLCFSRILFIPLFGLCNYQPRRYFPVVFSNDLYPILFNVFFAFSNGYLTSLCMMYGPQLVEPNLMETAGATMQLFLNIGTGLGAVLSIILVKFI